MMMSSVVLVYYIRHFIKYRIIILTLSGVGSQVERRMAVTVFASQTTIHTYAYGAIEPNCASMGHCFIVENGWEHWNTCGQIVIISTAKITTNNRTTIFIHTLHICICYMGKQGYDVHVQYQNPIRDVSIIEIALWSCGRARKLSNLQFINGHFICNKQ